MGAVDNGIWYVLDKLNLQLAADFNKYRYVRGSKKIPFSGADPKEIRSIYYADFVGPPALVDLQPNDGVFAIIDKDKTYSKGDKVTYSTPVRIYNGSLGFIIGGRGTPTPGISPDTAVYLSMQNTAAEKAKDYTFIWEFVKLRDQTPQAGDRTTEVKEGDVFFIRMKDTSGTYLYLKKEPGTGVIFTNPGTSPKEKINDYKWTAKFTFRNH